jgi:hypothetical protein
MMHVKPVILSLDPNIACGRNTPFSFPKLADRDTKLRYWPPFLQTEFVSPLQSSIWSHSNPSGEVRNWCGEVIRAAEADSCL